MAFNAFYYGTYFGVANGVDSLAVTEEVSTIDYGFGLAVSKWPLERTETIAAEKVHYDGHGIAPPDLPSLNTTGAVIDSVSYQRTDVVSAKGMVANTTLLACSSLATNPSTTDPEVLTYCSNLLWLGYECQLSIQGRFTSYGDAGEQILDMMTEGYRVASAIKILDLTGTYGPILGAQTQFHRQPMVTNVVRNCNANGWSTFSVQLEWMEPNVVASLDAGSMLLGSLTVLDPTLTDKFYKVTITDTLDSNGSPKRSESIEIYNEVDDLTVTDLHNSPGPSEFGSSVVLAS